MKYNSISLIGRDDGPKDRREYEYGETNEGVSNYPAHLVYPSPLVIIDDSLRVPSSQVLNKLKSLRASLSSSLQSNNPSNNSMSQLESDGMRNRLVATGTSDELLENKNSSQPQDSDDFSTAVLKSEPSEDPRNLSAASMLLAFQRLFIRCLHYTGSSSCNACNISDLRRFLKEDIQVKSKSFFLPPV